MKREKIIMVLLVCVLLLNAGMAIVYSTDVGEEKKDLDNYSLLPATNLSIKFAFFADLLVNNHIDRHLNGLNQVKFSFL